MTPTRSVLVLVLILAAACGSDASPPDAAPDVYEACPIRAEFRAVQSAARDWVEGAYYASAEPSPEGVREGACALIEGGPPQPAPAGQLVVSGPSETVSVSGNAEQRYWALGSPAEEGAPLRAAIDATPSVEVETVGAPPLARPPGPLAIHEHEPLAIAWEPAGPADGAELVLRLDNVEHGIDATLECSVPLADRALTVPRSLIDGLFAISRAKAGPHLEHATATVRRRGSAPVEGGCAVLDSEVLYELEQDMIPAGATPAD